MGFVLPKRVFKLLFDGDLGGLEVTARAAGTEQYLFISELAGFTWPASKRDVAKVRKLFEKFAEFLVSWNLEDENGPVPATVDGLLGLEPTVATRIILAWMDAVADEIEGPGLADIGQDIESTLPVEMIN